MRFRRLFNRPGLAGLAALAALLAAGCGGRPEAESLAASESTPRRGGGLVVGLRSEPQGFNPLFAHDSNTLSVLRRLHADLIHINRSTQETEPALAESWEVSEDGLRFILTLRPDLRFSDGQPLTVEDVLFTYRVYLDEEVGSPNRDLLLVGGKPITVRPLDERRILFELAEPYAVGDRLFDSIPILPRHRLEAAYLAGELTAAWGLDASPEEIVGLGAFRLREYVVGERIVLERNPNYWRRDDAGNNLPYLDTLTFLIIPNPETQVLRFQSGGLHLIDRLSAESFDLLSRDAEAGSYRLENLGPDLTFTLLFFNLNDRGPGSAIANQQRWFRQSAFRRAVSSAIDRQAIVDLVFLGRATSIASHASPGLKRWFNAELRPPERSLEKARDLLARAGFWWDESSRLRDSDGQPVAWTLITNSSNNQRVQIMAIVQEDLAEIGMEIQVVPMDFRAMLERIYQSRDYAACVLALSGGDADPNSQMSFLTSTGPQHLWRLAGASGVESWQAEIDRLMGQQLVTMGFEERRRLYHQVQALVAENLPFIPLVSPHVLVGAREEVGNFRPAILDHQTLWNAEELYLRQTPGG